MKYLSADWFKKILGLTVILVYIVSVVPVPLASALDQNALNNIFGYTPFYDPTACDSNVGGGPGGGPDITGRNANAGISDTGCASSCESSTVVAPIITGENVKDAYNFFVSNGWTPAQAAGIVGNLFYESGVDPTKQEDDGSGDDGYGIAQFTPPTAMEAWVAAQNEDPNSLSGQLDYIQYQLENTESSAGAALKVTSDVKDATDVILNDYERPADPAASQAQRETDAQTILTLYGGGSTTGSSTTATSTPSIVTTCSGGTGNSGAGGNNSGSSSPDCQAASGDAEILCDAEKYDTVSYSETIDDGGHQGAAAWLALCPVIGPSCYLDCSGLVNIAVYDAFGVDLRETTYTEVTDTTDWEEIPFSQIQPGDLIQPNTGHVEIVSSVQGNTIYTFGAHDDYVAQPQQVGPAQFTNTAGYVYLRYIGPGSGS